MVHVKVQKLKHGKKEFIGPIFVVFESFEQRKSFKVGYEILADNIPQKVSGVLNIQIE